MIVAVSMRLAPSPTYVEERDAISHDWVRALEQRGVTPVFVPNALRDPTAYLHAVRARGLILTGGDDVGRLSGEPESVPEWSERDRTESALLADALETGLPVLAVCRGLHLANAHLGGRIARGLSGHTAVTHEVRFLGSPLDLDLPGRAETNSYHDNGVMLDGLAPGLRAFAMAGEVVEGFLDPERPLVAIQWHPERENPARDLDERLLRGWLALCG